MRRPIVLLTLLLAVSLGYSLGESAFATKLKKLKADYTTAQNTFFEEYEKKPEKERGDFYTKHNPANTFVTKAIALARSAGGDPAGPQAYSFAVMVLQSANQPDTMKKVIKEAVAKYAKVGGLSELSTQLGYGTPLSKSETAGLLNTILKETKSDPDRIAATASLARLYKGWGEPAKGDEPLARKYLGQLIANWPNSKEATRAKGDLYELDNLRVGKEFPEFSTTDQEGKTWKLSDYRGRVVVLDFWGFW